MNPTTRKIVEELRKRIALKYSLQQFRVFGSSARGDSKKGSDIDVWVCLDKLNRSIEIFPISAKTGQGMADWYGWLKKSLKSLQS